MHTKYSKKLTQKNTHLIDLFALARAAFICDDILTKLTSLTRFSYSYFNQSFLHSLTQFTKHFALLADVSEMTFALPLFPYIAKFSARNRFFFSAVNFPLLIPLPKYFFLAQHVHPSSPHEMPEILFLPQFLSIYRSPLPRFSNSSHRANRLDRDQAQPCSFA